MHRIPRTINHSLPTNTSTDPRGFRRHEDTTSTNTKSLTPSNPFEYMTQTRGIAPTSVFDLAPPVPNRGVFTPTKLKQSPSPVHTQMRSPLHPSKGSPGSSLTTTGVHLNGSRSYVGPSVNSQIESSQSPSSQTQNQRPYSPGMIQNNHRVAQSPMRPQVQAEQHSPRATPPRPQPLETPYSYPLQRQQYQAAHPPTHRQQQGVPSHPPQFRSPQTPALQHPNQGQQQYHPRHPPQKATASPSRQSAPHAREPSPQRKSPSQLPQRTQEVTQLATSQVPNRQSPQNQPNRQSPQQSVERSNGQVQYNQHQASHPRLIGPPSQPLSYRPQTPTSGPQPQVQSHVQHQNQRQQPPHLQQQQLEHQRPEAALPQQVQHTQHLTRGRAPLTRLTAPPTVHPPNSEHPTVALSANTPHTPPQQAPSQQPATQLTLVQQQQLRKQAYLRHRQAQYLLHQQRQQQTHAQTQTHRPRSVLTSLQAGYVLTRHRLPGYRTAPTPEHPEGQQFEQVYYEFVPRNKEARDRSRALLAEMRAAGVVGGEHAKEVLVSGTGVVGGLAAIAAGGWTQGGGGGQGHSKGFEGLAGLASVQGANGREAVPVVNEPTGVVQISGEGTAPKKIGPGVGPKEESDPENDAEAQESGMSLEEGGAEHVCGEDMTCKYIAHCMTCMRFFCAEDVIHSSKNPLIEEHSIEKLSKTNMQPLQLLTSLHAFYSQIKPLDDTPFGSTKMLEEPLLHSTTPVRDPIIRVLLERLKSARAAYRLGSNKENNLERPEGVAAFMSNESESMNLIRAITELDEAPRGILRRYRGEETLNCHVQFHHNYIMKPLERLFEIIKISHGCLRGLGLDPATFDKPIHDIMKIPIRSWFAPDGMSIELESAIRLVEDAYRHDRAEFGDDLVDDVLLRKRVQDRMHTPISGLERPSAKRKGPYKIIIPNHKIVVPGAELMMFPILEIPETPRKPARLVTPKTMEASPASKSPKSSNPPRLNLKMVKQEP